MDISFSADESDASSSMNDEMNDILDMIGNKCSICFTEDSTVELVTCGDQFCYGCLEKYWKVKLEDSSWGIRPVKLDCPVCRENVTDTNWLAWVSGKVRDAYIRMMGRRPQLVRSCSDCGHEQQLLGESLDEESLQDLLETFIAEEVVSETARGQIRRRLEQADFASLLRHLNRNLINPAPAVKRMYFLRKLLQAASQRLGVGGEDSFANLQLAVIKCCSGTICDFCSAQICLRCGANDWHPGVACVEHMGRCLQTVEKGSADYNSLLWKSQHGKSCPQCYLLITKDDDGSCNQMRCTFCSFAFCWGCLREWSPNCGYYSCSYQREEEKLDPTLGKREKLHKREHEDARPEAGIPDVTKLPSFSPPS